MMQQKALLVAVIFFLLWLLFTIGTCNYRMKYQDSQKEVAAIQKERDKLGDSIITYHSYYLRDSVVIVRVRLERDSLKLLFSKLEKKRNEIHHDTHILSTDSLMRIWAVMSR